jgi:hypothetical protein
MADEHGWELIAVRPLSDDPDDAHLGFVLCRRDVCADPDLPYCTHLINMSSLRPDYFAIGHYDMTLDTAIEDFCTRK